MNTTTEKTKKYEPYPKYKPSGVEWLGNVPEHWEVKRLKYLIAKKITDGPHTTPNFISEGFPFLSVDGIQDGELVFENCRYISEDDHNEYKQKAFPRHGDILLGKAASTGKVARVKIDIEFSIWSPLALIKINSRSTDSVFMEYAFKSPEIQSQIDILCTSNTQKNISMDDIPLLWFTCPPLPEQRTIADFLDHRTGAIDELIAKKERVIELLREKRTALISHAVTKGLNPDAKMKDSGIDWLGEIPEHWEVVPIKRIVSATKNAMVDGPFGSSVNVANDYVDEGVPVVRTINITKNGFNEDDLMFMRVGKYQELKRHAVYPNDVLFSKVGTIGNSCLFPEHLKEGILSTTGSCKITLDNIKIIPKYLVNLLCIMADHFNLLASSNVQPFLNMQTIKNVKIPISSLDEQKRIIDYLDHETSKIDALIAKVTEAIEKLKEYRTALISAAVTGKIKVF